MNKYVLPINIADNKDLIYEMCAKVSNVLKNKTQQFFTMYSVFCYKSEL